MDQVVLYSEPDCMSLRSPVTTKLTGRKSQNSSPATNSAWTTGDTKEEDSGEKLNKTRRENVGESGEGVEGSTLYPVYVYLIDKNGTYDQILTESFIDLWNLTKVQDLLLFNRVRTKSF